MKNIGAVSHPADDRMLSAFAQVPNLGREAEKFQNPWAFAGWLQGQLSSVGYHVKLSVVPDARDHLKHWIRLGSSVEGTLVQWRKFTGRREFSRRTNRWNAATSLGLRRVQRQALALVARHA